MFKRKIWSKIEEIGKNHELEIVRNHIEVLIGDRYKGENTTLKSQDPH